MKDLKTFVCLSSKCECNSAHEDCSECDSKIDEWLDEHDKAIRADERVKTLDELETKLQCWDKGANAIPNYVWKCIRDMKGGAENGKL